MLDKSSKGIIAEGDPKLLKDQSQNPFVRRFFNRQTDDEKHGGQELSSLRSRFE
jgi:phospholipid/cholesterol/gamma-HCH transport system ATP-binding protein